jgi:hypothetical protein
LPEKEWQLFETALGERLGTTVFYEAMPEKAAITGELHGQAIVTA